MTNQQIRDELVTMLVAGHETTSQALAWTFYALSQDTGIEDRLHAELETVLGGQTPTFDHLSNLPYTRQVIEETLRLFPPTVAIARRAIEEDEIGGYTIPKDSIIFLTPFFTQRRPDFWPDPLHFDPDRFTPELAANRHKHAYFPFGSGPRTCIGNTFAMMESTLILAMIAQRYRLRLVPNFPVEPWAALTMRPRYGLKMFLHPR